MSAIVFLLVLIPLLFTKNTWLQHTMKSHQIPWLFWASCLSKFSSGISAFFRLPCTWLFFRLTWTSRVKYFSFCQTVSLIVHMLLSNLPLREPAWVFLLFLVPFNHLNCLRLLFSPFFVLMTYWFLFVWWFFLVLNANGAALSMSKPTLLSNPSFLL